MRVLIIALLAAISYAQTGISSKPFFLLKELVVLLDSTNKVLLRKAECENFWHPLCFFCFFCSLAVTFVQNFFIHKALKQALRYQRGRAVDFLVKHSTVFGRLLLFSPRLRLTFYTYVPGCPYSS